MIREQGVNRRNCWLRWRTWLATNALLLPLAIVAPAVGTPAPPVTAATNAGEAGACHAEDLRAGANYQGATGSLRGAVLLTNGGAAACDIVGQPQLRILDARGDVVTESAPTMSTLAALTLGPGELAAVGFVWRNYCRTPSLPPFTLRITLTTGARLDVTQNRYGEPFGGSPRCDAPSAPSTLTVDSPRLIPPTSATPVATPTSTPTLPGMPDTGAGGAARTNTAACRSGLAVGIMIVGIAVRRRWCRTHAPEKDR